MASASGSGPPKDDEGVQGREGGRGRGAASVEPRGKEKIGEGSTTRAPPLDFEELAKNVRIADYPPRGPRIRRRRRKAKKPDSLLTKLLKRSILAFQSVKKKLSVRKGKQLDEASTPKSPPHVDHKKIPMDEAVYHYYGDLNTAIQKCIALPAAQSFGLGRLVSLDSHYSELRPVHRDGESFYRSFIFSYLEQIVDRVDTREEDRLLGAVRGLARRAEHFQWASEFSKRREAFQRLIEKIKGWKLMSEVPTSTRRGEFLLEFFSSYDTTDDIFAFLRLAAAIWMCSPDNRSMYAAGVTELGNRSLEDWCLTQVVPPRVHADSVTMNALAAALQVAIRVETPDFGGRQDMYYISRDTPQVCMMRVEDPHYDIVYPLSPDSIHGRHVPEEEEEASWFKSCCTGGGDSDLPRPARPRQQRGGGGGGAKKHRDPEAGTSSSGGAEGDGAESSRQGAARARWLRSCVGGSKKKQS
ncbi:OVARIAN TUMOR DOMAIN-containing deubiquitinating enzyme 1-like [Oryza brachyantha]|uniref:OVARIAN TUMOR DOMAIN-containing deubiquitinating enzyme 1-like n=1 Tax=Oryza brachyantha TaxID=4533 RepID=UPI0007761101|nr:OVARIAN TUMOR DOMAIN-containing deubiquitinating enzyme 1-like [Oryza brachyantha]